MSFHAIGLSSSQVGTSPGWTEAPPGCDAKVGAARPGVYSTKANRYAQRLWASCGIDTGCEPPAKAPPAKAVERCCTGEREQDDNCPDTTRRILQMRKGAESLPITGLEMSSGGTPWRLRKVPVRTLSATYRRQGGIEPLGLSTPTDLKSVPGTIRAQAGIG